MPGEELRLLLSPIVEAIIDIQCDVPPETDFGELQDRAKQSLSAVYPKVRPQVIRTHHLGVLGPSEGAIPQRVIGLRFLTEDERQIVRFRGEGYSFHRLPPYGRLSYLPDIEWSWNVYRDLTRPVQIRTIGLRFIHRIPLPIADGAAAVGKYLRGIPQLPNDETLQLTGFLNQQSAVEVTTGHHVNTTLVAQPPEGNDVPIIFDIETSDAHARSGEDWQDVREAILSLGRLKNHVFQKTLTEECLNLFRSP